MLLSWAEEGDDATGLRIVVLKGLFTPEEMQGGKCRYSSSSPRLLLHVMRVSASIASPPPPADNCHSVYLCACVNICFTRRAADEAVQDELAEDVAEEAAALGEIDRLDVFSKHPEGVVVIKYKSPGAAADAISTFHNRWFGGRMIKCEYWDGKTEYRLAARAKAVHFACVIPRPLCSTFQFWCFTLVAVSTVQIEGVES